MTEHATDPATHWEEVYRRVPATTVSWYRPRLDRSIALLLQARVGGDSRVIDVGGGASTLVDDLLEIGVAKMAVVDLSETALSVARERLGSRADCVDWFVGDITTASLAIDGFTHWHDRAVLHFLTDEQAVGPYRRALVAALVPGGHAVIGGFAPDGPERCSGLPVVRRSAQDIAALAGDEFQLVVVDGEGHQTPGGRSQSFAYAVLRRR